MKKRTLNKRRLTKKEVKDLIATVATLHTDYTQFFEKIYPSGKMQKDQIYLLPNEQILYVFAENDISSPGRGDIYPHDYFIRWIKEIKRQDKNFERNISSSVAHWIFYSKYGNKIIDHLPQLVSELGEKLEIPKNKLNLTYESLDLVSAKIRKYELDYVFENLYDHLIAYVGEVLKLRVNGHWDKMSQYPYPDIPFISIDLKNVAYMPLNVVWCSLNEIDPCDLREEAANEVRSLSGRVKFEREYGEKFRKTFLGQ